MPSITIRVDTLKNAFPGMPAKLQAGLRAAVQKAVFDATAQAKVRAPVDTGALRNSITGAMTGDTSGEVTTGVEYAVHQEYGTVKMAAHPFMHPAADAVMPGFVAAVKQVAEGLA